MSAFLRKKLNAPPKRVCLRLKELRLEKGTQLEEMTQKTKIDKKYLRALEECRFEDLPKAKIYQKNIVRCYVEALGIKPEPFLQQYLLEESKKEEKKHPYAGIKNNPWHHLPVILRYSLLLSVAFILFGYLGWQVKNIIAPPSLVIYSPQDGYITKNDQLLVVGETEKEVAVTINGRTVGNSENGQFKETINLSPGVNTITIIAQKKHGKTTTETRNVVFKHVDNNI